MGASRVRKGTSLAELLVALIVVTIFATSLFNALTAATLNTNNARYRAVALGLARDAIESQVVQARNGRLIAEGVISNRSNLGLPTTFTINRTNSQISVGTATDVFKVRAVVTWKYPSGKSDSLSLELWIKDGDG